MPAIPPAATAAVGLPPTWATPPLVLGDDRTEFNRLLESLVCDVEPRGAVEEMYVSDMAVIVWELLRLRRCRAATVTAEVREVAAAAAGKAIGNAADAMGIEAEAMGRARIFVNAIDRQHTALEARRDKMLSCIANYRAKFAHAVRTSAERIVNEAGRGRSIDAGDDELRRVQQIEELLRHSS